MRRPNFGYSLSLCTILILAIILSGCAEGFSFISKDQLKQDLTNPGTTVVDVRTNRDWNSSQWKIEGAQRQSPTEIKEWMGQYPKDKTIILYCA